MFIILIDIITGFANSITFKTSKTHLAQPVIAGTLEVRKLVQLYVDVVRPFVALADEDEEKAFLFLRLDGTQDKKLERYVISFFKTELNLHITTTTVRKIVDTTVADLRLRGLLNDAQVDAVHFVNGHTELTSNDFYVQ